MLQTLRLDAFPENIQRLLDAGKLIRQEDRLLIPPEQPYATVSFYPITFKNKQRGILIEAPTTIGNKVDINGRDVIPNMNFVRDCMAAEELFIRCGALFKDGKEVTPEAPLANIIIEHRLPPGSRIIYAEAQGR